ncbi:hypothetical protein K3U93_05540 [Mycobacterium malmoense]|uniref:PE-PGRS family protein n=1 Tax=Mycobacterium malmoense TaxID=1780 RepID=A0ABX3SKE3_MYCMA|nr:hypothetical protein [Mycobacterium malmoense]ORA76837.1 hypothetical protein BST29_24365 [Mycobacterium malmoense]QZA18651.1 hypothetical protein K3U93_05540 [Mycobacterium malmoense]UNB95423.1 hypothetical protein H5T25_05530 [Mycobacterium malmoense]
MTIQIIDSKGIKRMQQLAALRPLVSAGAAAVGASLIALTPAVSNDLASDIQHGTTIIQQRAVELTDYVANPVQTWIDVFEAAGINISSLATQYQQHPFPVPQQMAANFLQYAVEYVKPYQTAANQGIGYFLGTPNTSTLGIFLPQLGTALADIKAGNITSAFSIFNTLFFDAALYVGEPLETIPQILNPITQNLANATAYLTDDAIANVGVYFVSSLPDEFFGSLGTSLQNVYNSFTAGDPLGALINAIDVPGALTNAVLNGTPFSNGTYGGGLISDGGGLANTLSLLTPQGLAKDMVAPNAQNIMSGGSLPFALGYLANLVTTGFPTPQTFFDNLLSAIQFAIGNPVGAAEAISPAASSVMAGLPGLSADVLKAFDPAAVTNIAASLGPSLAANVAGSLGSSLGANIAGTLAVELPTLALHILSAL